VLEDALALLQATVESLQDQVASLQAELERPEDPNQKIPKHFEKIKERRTGSAAVAASSMIL
jgi:uncharacterized small protein (DUF1192 family)